MKPAGFWVRFAASLIDTVIVAFPLVGLVYWISGGEWLDATQMRTAVQHALAGDAKAALRHAQVAQMQWEVVFELLLAGVIIVFWRRWSGATPGKKILGITVVDADTNKEISNKQAIIRYIGYIASTLILLVGFFMVAFRKDKRALHDLLADTKVVYLKQEEGNADAVTD